MSGPVAGAGTLRVGIVDYLNSRPLARGLLCAPGDATLVPIRLSPAAVADRLRSAELEVGLVPSIELQRIEGLRVVPGLAVAATHEVRSVLLVTRGRIEAVREVLLDENSRTSATLVRLLLVERYGLRPRFRTAAPRLDRMLDASDAALVIGDPALHVDRRGLTVLDLAAEWRRLTGLPFVFAVWAVRPGVEVGDLVGRLRSSLREGMRDLEAICREAAAETGLAVETLRAYFAQNLRYELGPEELEGLREFFRRAHAHDLLAPPRPVEFLPE